MEKLEPVPMKCTVCQKVRYITPQDEEEEAALRMAQDNTVCFSCWPINQAYKKLRDGGGEIN